MSDAFNKIALRRLYNPLNRGKGTEGKTTRESLHTTVTYPTFIALSTAIPVKKGGYGAPVVELALRIVLCICGHFPVSVVGEEMAQALLPRRIETAKTLRELADFVEGYK